MNMAVGIPGLREAACCDLEWRDPIPVTGRRQLLVQTAQYVFIQGYLCEVWGWRGAGSKPEVTQLGHRPGTGTQL